MIWSTDLKRLRRDPFVVAAWAGYCLCLVFALLGGLAWHNGQTADHVAFVSQERFHDPKRLESPSRIELPISRSPSPGMALSVGRSDIEPSAGFTSFFTREDTIFRNYQIGAPVVEAAGRVDADFVVIWLAPLLLIALGISLLASDRDGGQLRLRATAAAREGRQLLVRAGLRWLLAAAPVAAIVLLVALATPAAAGKADGLMLWLAAALAYLALWQAIIMLASTWSFRQEVLGASLFGLWALWLVVVPAVASATAQSLSPPPSRLLLVADARATEAAARAQTQQLYKQYLHDHPEFMAVDEIDVRMRNYAMMYSAVEVAVRPRLAQFAQARDKQRRIAATVSLLSPALLAHDVLVRAAGTSDSDYAAFQDQALAYHRHARDRLLADGLAGRRYTASSAPIPAFTFQPQNFAPAVAIVLSITVLALMAVAVALRRAHFGRLQTA